MGGIFVIHAAVVIVYLVADKGIVNLQQSVYDSCSLFFGRPFNQPLIDLSYIPVRGDRISAVLYVVKAAISDGRFPDKVITDAVDIIAVVDVRQLINFFQAFLSKGVYYVFSGILCRVFFVFLAI